MILSSFKGQRYQSVHPLCGGEFHELLETCQTVTPETGWQPVHVANSQGVLPGYLKQHSYGEYIFDWAWANFYHQHGMSYYPKLIHALPFTPINAPKVLGDQSQFEALAQESRGIYLAHPQISGEHYLFTSQEENEILKKMGFEVMHTLQFHWTNKYKNFNEFLESLTANRRKMIQKERKKVAQYDLQIRLLTGKDLNEEIMQEIFNLYLTTIEKKNSQAYLNQDFFTMLPNFLSTNTCILGAFENNQLVAMSLFFKSSRALYGRYWGIRPEVEEKYRLLHFELCYYRGMEICLNENIPLFEAGAQGEQKLWRGFDPVTITSAHHIKIREMFSAIKHYISEQNQRNEELIQSYKTLLPYKSQL